VIGVRKSPRAPFVVTVGIGLGVGLGTACSSGSGSTSPEQDSGDLDSSIGSDGEGVDSGVADSSADGSDSDNPPECPKDDPGFGAKQKPCTAPMSVRCSYADGCNLRPPDAGAALNVYFCHAGVWSLFVDYTPICPTVAPKVGDPCPCSPHMLYVACLYGTCEGKDRVYEDCQTADTFDDTWKSTPVSCNPPEPDGGLDGDANDGG